MLEGHRFLFEGYVFLFERQRFELFEHRHFYNMLYVNRLPQTPMFKGHKTPPFSHNSSPFSHNSPPFEQKSTPFEHICIYKNPPR